MVFKGNEFPFREGRKHFPIEGCQSLLGHFVCRITTPENPFGPHQHEGEEFWYILEGEGILLLEGQEIPVEEGDLVLLPAWKEHGLKSAEEIRWLCFG